MKRKKRNYIQISIRFPAEMHEELQRRAEESGLYINQIVLKRIELGMMVEKIIRKHMPDIIKETAQENMHDTVDYIFTSGRYGDYGKYPGDGHYEPRWGEEGRDGKD
jgi:hypothetical protein